VLVVLGVDVTHLTPATGCVNLRRGYKNLTKSDSNCTRSSLLYNSSSKANQRKGTNASVIVRFIILYSYLQNHGDVRLVQIDRVRCGGTENVVLYDQNKWI
jgi:hypothetical protein